jgi:hypothetical protein
MRIGRYLLQKSDLERRGVRERPTSFHVVDRRFLGHKRDHLGITTHNSDLKRGPTIRRYFGGIAARSLSAAYTA